MRNVCLDCDYYLTEMCPKVQGEPVCELRDAMEEAEKPIYVLMTDCTSKEFLGAHGFHYNENQHVWEREFTNPIRCYIEALVLERWGSAIEICEEDGTWYTTSRAFKEVHNI